MGLNMNYVCDTIICARNIMTEEMNMAPILMGLMS